MAIYAMSDLHLPLGIDKPMDIFGPGWENYVEHIYKNWINTVKNEDTVLICGDLSWATYLEESIRDFEFLMKLPGKKVISKGNHDYWWSTQAKLDAFLKDNNFENIVFLHNNSIIAENYAICGARGWKSPFDKDFTKEDEKIYEREIIRLRLSLEEGKKLSDKIIVMMHYPPDVGFGEILEEYNVEYCVFGHLHGNSHGRFPESERDKLVSADYLRFMPKRIAG